MIYVECKPDTVMARSLVAGEEVRHLSGTSRVCHMLMEQSYCRGMVDENDGARKHPYVKKLTALGLVSEQSQCDLIICEDNSQNNRLILLRPRLEEWVIATARIAGLDLRRYRLPDQPNQLHDVLTLANRQVLNQFRIFVQRLLSASHRMKTLASLLRET